MDKETNCLNMFSASNKKILVVKTRCFPVLGFVWGNRPDLNVIRDITIPIQLIDVGWSRRRRGFTCYGLFWGHCYEINRRNFYRKKVQRMKKLCRSRRNLKIRVWERVKGKSSKCWYLYEEEILNLNWGHGLEKTYHRLEGILNLKRRFVSLGK